MTSEKRLDELHAAFSSTARAVRGDGLSTVFQVASTGQPVGARAVKYTSEPILCPEDVEALLAHDWRARREITQPKGDVIRAGLEIKGLPAWVDVDAVMSALEGDPVDGETQSAPLAALGELWGEGESYGGAVLVAVADDGLHASEPLDKARLQEVRAWVVLDRWSIHPFRSGGLAAPVDYWIITGETGGLGLTAEHLTSSAQIVHPSRVIVHTGMWMPRRWRLRHEGWGLSRLEVLFDQRQNASLGNAKLGRMLERGSQDVAYIAELSELIQDQGDAYVGKRLQTMNQGLSMFNMLFLDGGIEGADNAEPGRLPDKFETMARPLNGASDISEAQHQDWMRGSGMPPVVANGEVSAGGLSTGNEAGPWKAWAGKIAAEQQANLTRWVNWQLGLIFASKNGPTGGRVPDTWTIEWISIAEPDPEFEARVGLIEAQADKIYSEVGTLTDEEIRQHRNVDGKRGPVRVESAEVLPPPDGA
jgi:hypothetical protein